MSFPDDSVTFNIQKLTDQDDWAELSDDDEEEDEDGEDGMHTLFRWSYLFEA